MVANGGEGYRCEQGYDERVESHTEEPVAACDDLHGAQWIFLVGMNSHAFFVLHQLHYCLAFEFIVTAVGSLHGHESDVYAPRRDLVKT